MKYFSRTRILFIFGLCVAAYYFFKSYGKGESFVSQKIVEKVAQPKTSNLTNSKFKVGTLIRTPLIRKLEQLSVDENPSCAAVSDALLNQDAMTVLHDFREKRIDLPLSCRSFQSLAANTKFIVENCIQKEKDVDERQCLSNLLFLKSYLVRLNTKEKSVGTMSDQELLLSAFGAMLGVNADTLKETAHMRAVSNELFSRSQFENTAYKLKTTSYLLNSDEIKRPEISLEFEKTVTEGYKRFPNDPEMAEAYLGAWHFILELEAQVQFYSRFVRDNPDSSLGFYNLASSYWSEKNRELAILSLEKAVALEPKNKRYNETLEAARTAELGKIIFGLKISMPFDGF